MERDGATGSYILTGELRDQKGEYVRASINIDDKIEIVEYLEDRTWEIFHRQYEDRTPSPG
jgi:hypothetical protein